MVVAILGEGRGRAAVLLLLNAPAVEFDRVEPLLAARWSGAQRWKGRSDVAGGIGHATKGSRKIGPVQIVLGGLIL